MQKPFLVLSAVLLLAACGGGGRTVAPAGMGIGQYAMVDSPIQCVPYARSISSVQIMGDAWTWWDRAQGVYARGSQPAPGSVLVLSRTDRLRLGHLSVVQRVLGPREITVSHSNFGSDRATRSRIYSEQSAVDVSPRNDWTQIRFWNPDYGSYGFAYEAYGFIYPRETRTAAR